MCVRFDRIGTARPGLAGCNTRARPARRERLGPWTGTPPTWSREAWGSQRGQRCFWKRIGLRQNTLCLGTTAARDEHWSPPRPRLCPKQLPGWALPCWAPSRSGEGRPQPGSRHRLNLAVGKIRTQFSGWAKSGPSSRCWGPGGVGGHGERYFGLPRAPWSCVKSRANDESFCKNKLGGRCIQKHCLWCFGYSDVSQWKITYSILPSLLLRDSELLKVLGPFKTSGKSCFNRFVNWRSWSEAGSVASYSADLCSCTEIFPSFCTKHALSHLKLPQEMARRGACALSSSSPFTGTGLRDERSAAWSFYFKFKQTLLETDLSAGQKAPSQAVLFPSLLQLCLSFFPMPFTITVFPSLEAKQLESWKRSVVRRVIKIGIDAAGSQGSVTSLALCVSVMSDTVALPCVASLCIFYCLVLPENVDPGVAALRKQSAVEGSALCKPFMFPL